MSWFTGGFHWKNLYHENLTFYNLVYYRVAEMYPELDDPEDAPAEIDCYYGSRGASLTLRTIDDEAVSLFAWGYCTLLALALHDLTGLPLVLFTKKYDGRDWSGHAAVQLPNGLFLDITGLRDATDINRTYHMNVEPVFPTRDEYCAIIATDEHVDNPYSFVDELEQLVLFDFARTVVDTYATPYITVS